MHVEEVKNEGLAREYRVCIPAVRLAEKIEAFLLNKGKTVRIPGYSRPGKVPLSALRQRFLKEALHHALETFQKEGYKETLKSCPQPPASPPQYTIHAFQEGSDVEYVIAFELLPEIPEISWDSAELCRYTPIVTDDDVAKELQKMAAERKTSRPLAQPRPAQKGDTVIVDIDMISQKSGSQPQEMKDLAIELKEGEFLTEFIDLLLGTQPGDVCEAPWRLPDDMVKSKKQKQKLQVKFTVKDVQETVPFQVDEAFAQASHCENLDALKGQVHEMLRSRGNDIANQVLKRHVFDYLNQKYPFSLPQSMVQEESRLILSQMFQAQHLTLDQLPVEAQRREQIFSEKFGCTEAELYKKCQLLAENRIRLALILKELAQRNNVSLSSDEITAVLTEEAKKWPGQEQKVFDHYTKNRAALERLVEPVFEKKILDTVLAQAGLQEKGSHLNQLADLYAAQSSLLPSASGTQQEKASI